MASWTLPSGSPAGLPPVPPDVAATAAPHLDRLDDATMRWLYSLTLLAERAAIGRLTSPERLRLLRLCAVIEGEQGAREQAQASERRAQITLGLPEALGGR